MSTLHPHLIGFLEGLCAASVTRYPEYGMFLRGPVFGSEIPPEPAPLEAVSKEMLQKFFLCALSDTSASRPQEAAYVVGRLLALLDEHHPNATLRYRLPETRGWFDGLEVWLVEPAASAYFFLDWSVS